MVASWRTQAVKIHKNFDPFKYSLRVNNTKTWGKYSSIFKPRTWNYLHLDWINMYRNDVITSTKRSLPIETTGKHWDCSWEFIQKQGPRFRNAYFVGGINCTQLLYQVILLVWTDIEFIYKHIMKQKPSESLRCTRVIPIQYLPSPSYPLTQRHT